MTQDLGDKEGLGSATNFLTSVSHFLGAITLFHHAWHVLRGRHKTGTEVTIVLPHLSEQESSKANGHDAS